MSMLREEGNQLFQCPVCEGYADSEVELSFHVEEHFDTVPARSSDGLVPCASPSSFPLVTFSPEPDCSVSSSLDLLDILTSMHPGHRNPQQPSIERIHFVQTPFVHYVSVPGVDSGWGCGYRNIQTLLSSLMQESQLRQLVFDGSGRVPSIDCIQRTLESAWRHGFDPDGAAQLRNLVGTKKWIGTTECFTLLTFFGIDCTIVDFVGVSSHPSVMLEYLTRLLDRPQTGAFPMYFQHNGHSRTLIGVERYRNGIMKLILADPSLYGGLSYEERFRTEGLAAMPQLRRRMNSLRRNDEFQVLFVRNRKLSPEEQMQRKVVSSLRIDCRQGYRTAQR